MTQTPMQLVLYSSIDRGHLSFADPGLSGLRRLCALDIVRLSIPSVVEREVLPALHQDAAQAFEQYTATLTKLQGYMPTATVAMDLHLHMAKLHEEDIHSWIRAHWDRFKTDTGGLVPGGSLSMTNGASPARERFSSGASPRCAPIPKALSFSFS